MSIFLLGVAALISTTLIDQWDGPVWQVIVVLGLFLATAVSSVYASWLIRDGYGAGWPSRAITIALLAPPTLSWIVTLFIPGATLYGAIPLWITLSIFLALMPRAHRWGVTAVGLALIVVHGLINPGTPAFLEGRFLLGLALLILITPTTFLFSGWLWHLITRLDAARTVSSQLAVARERLRFASDLHDIQGHHLQVIALKAELADRLLASDTAKHQHAAQLAIAEVRTLAEQAQSETRQLVRDLRVVSLTDELENARDVLEAAGITTEVSVASDVDFTATVEANRFLGLAVREATTNILRHANATRVQIELHTDAGLHLDIRNDGVNQRAQETQGTGLDGLRTRFEAAGGKLTTVQERDTFHLRATLPETNRKDTT